MTNLTLLISAFLLLTTMPALAYQESERGLVPQSQMEIDKARLKQLSNPDLVRVTFWLNLPGKTHFSSQDEVTVYYKISDLGGSSAAYFSLFNISPSGDLSILLNNEPIEAGRIYSLPKTQTSWFAVPSMTARLRLQTGREYFKALVTAIRIKSWSDFLSSEEMTRELRRVKFLGTQTLIVDVD